MLLMDAVESQLGSLEIWPTTILTLIFAHDPHMLHALPQLEAVLFFLRQWCSSPNSLSILQRVQWTHIHACEGTIPFLI